MTTPSRAEPRRQLRAATSRRRPKSGVIDRGRFIWPSAKEGVVSISAGQMAYMLEGIDWRNPQLTWRPKSAG
jgi:transposase